MVASSSEFSAHHSKDIMDPNLNENEIDLSAAVEFNRKYDIRERLGKGLSSVVYVCVEKSTGIELAVKVMDISVNHINADGMDIVQQIHEEIRLLRLVEGHHYINRLVDVFESTTFIFLVFELCQNIDLFDYLSEHVSLSEKRCRAIMKQIFEAVYHCHKRKVLHRDIKPENILLDEDFNIKLTDFGLAKEMKEGQRLYECAGTPGYLAPEVLEAGMCEQNECPGYSFEVDAWACGVVMYTLLVGTPPFWHHRQLNMIRMIMRGQYSMDGPAWNSVTSETKDLIKRLLVVNPLERLTVEQALDHEVFHAQRFTRIDGELLCIVHESDKDDNDVTDNGPVKVTNNKSSSSFQFHPALFNVVTPVMSLKKLTIPKQEIISSKQRHLTSITVISDANVKFKFNAKKTFKTAILCVRFLVRLKRIKITPVLFSLDATRCNPYHMRNIRHSIDHNAFGLYNHWIQKGQCQDRAAVFQHSPKRDLKKKNKIKKNQDRQTTF